MALNCQKHPSKYLLRMRKMQKIEPSKLIFMTDGSFRGCKRIKREVVFSFIYILIYIYICNGCMPVRAMCKPHSPDLKKRRARGCSLWRSLLERPPPAPESRVRDPLGARRVRMVWTRGGYIYIYIYIYI